MGGQKSISSCQHHFILSQVPETAWSSTRAKDVGPTRRSPRANSTFYILCRGLFWALHYQRRNEGTEALWRAFHLHGFQSCAHRTANSLKTDAFIYALRRFICRRGPFRQLRSDQGTNFMGARTELAQALAEMDQEKIRTKLLEELCDWISFKMNVPAASHMGGVWEHQSSARNVLSSLLQKNGRQLDDESLRTLMCEAKAIVNSRPLTVSHLADPDSLSPLTPNHLLTMKTKVVLAPPGAFQPADVYCRKRWRRVTHLANEFWTRWRKQFLLSLQQRQRWTHPRRNLTGDDVIMIKDENLHRNVWQLARVSAVYPR